MDRIMVAMSGGIDSSVTAAILNEKGYEVLGITMRIVPDYVNEAAGQEGGCCAVEDAKKVAAHLNIKHYTVNFKDIFHDRVIENFAEEYSSGRTPNPCIICNKTIKFSALKRRAEELDCDGMATGHYARKKHSKGRDRYLLRRARDENKDQSYMLYKLDQQQLNFSCFPLGDWSKEKVRERAEKINLPVKDKKESQEICFVPGDNYVDFLEKNFSNTGSPGPIYYVDGQKIGTHQGLHKYTVGQRRGLGISLSHPVYVIEINREDNSIIVGPRKELSCSGLIADNANWIYWENPPQTFQAEVQIRYNSTPRKAGVVLLSDNRLRIDFEEKVEAVAPGQSAVLYRKDIVLGGGRIRRAIR